MMQQPILYFFLILYIYSFTNSCHCLCGKEEYTKCTILADTLLNDTRLIYPDNLEDIHLVCRTWIQFVDCVTKYTNLCFNDNKKKEFNAAVENPVDLVHKMCNSPIYQNEYLKHAPCMRAALTNETQCGNHYRRLVSQVSGELATLGPSLCCSHFRFRECILDETLRTCDTDAYPFARHILNKTMGFLQQQCSGYRPSKLDCPEQMHSDNEHKMTPIILPMTSNSIRPTIRVILERTDLRFDEERNLTTNYEWMTSTSMPSSSKYNTSKQVSENLTNSTVLTMTTYSEVDVATSTDIISQNASENQSTELPSTQITKLPTMSNSLMEELNQQGLVDNDSAYMIKSGGLIFHIFMWISFYSQRI